MGEGRQNNGLSPMIPGTPFPVSRPMGTERGTIGFDPFGVVLITESSGLRLNQGLTWQPRRNGFPG
jgi:hypothetical protein